ncbi:inositol monophosphatase [Candidatus Kaiserbacteria bacterium]|nr:inositol monophosphatase [Candidatus Kaiserbacteria bacterium]
MKSVSFMETAEGLAKDAGAIMRKNFGLAMKKEWKDHRSPVTETDIAINDMVLKAIKKRYPDHSILSEEGDDFSEKSEYVWICDPVDGTHNFSHGIPTATFALALVRSGQPILSVVLDPFLERLFSAEKGKGAFLNGHQIHVNKNAGLKKTVIGCGKTKKVRNLFPFMDETYDYGVSFITGLSIHYMCALVAAGEFSAAIFGGTSAHDMTAGKVLVEEAGGKVTDIFGGMPERFDRDMQGQLCSNGLLHDELLAIMDRTSPRQ